MRFRRIVWTTLRALYAFARYCLRATATVAICFALGKPLGLWLLWAGLRPGWFGTSVALCIAIYVFVAVSHAVRYLDKLLDQAISEVFSDF